MCPQKFNVGFQFLAYVFLKSLYPIGKEKHYQMLEKLFGVFHETINLPCFARVHEKSTALQCEICDKGFSDKSKLKRHVSSVHEGKRPHKCDICGSCFTQKSHLDGHVAAVHGDKSGEYKLKGTLFFTKVSGLLFLENLKYLRIAYHSVLEQIINKRLIPRANTTTA